MAPFYCPDDVLTRFLVRQPISLRTCRDTPACAECAKRTAAIAVAMARMSDKAIGDAGCVEHSETYGLRYQCGVARLTGQIQPMDFCSGRGANHSNSSTIARICNEAMDEKTRFYVPDSVQHHTSVSTHKFAYMPRRASARRVREANRSHSRSYGEDERQSNR